MQPGLRSGIFHSLATLLLLLTYLFSSAAYSSVAVLNSLDKHPSITLSADKLGAIFTDTLQHRAVRSDVAIEPGSGFYYFEGHREVAAGNFGFGVATASETLNNYGGYSTQSLGVNTLGYIYYNRASVLGGPLTTITAADTYGFAVDYRGVHPVVYVIINNSLFFTKTLSEITDPLHIFVYGRSTTAGVQQSINTDVNLSQQAFVYDAATILTAAAVAGANTLQAGWFSSEPETTITIISQPQLVNTGDQLLLEAVATDAQGIDISNTISWLDTFSGSTGSGSSFTVSATTPGSHIIQASVVNEAFEPVVTSINITFEDPDTDGDGLTDATELQLGTDPFIADTDDDGLGDGAEVNQYGTDPLNPDTDNDSMPDGFEVLHGSNPSVIDFDYDGDNDGFSNYEEFLANTNPSNKFSYPGGPNSSVLDSASADSSVFVSADGLSARFTDSVVRGVRGTETITPGSGWFYIEAQRLTANVNIGLGVGSSFSATLVPGQDQQSLAINSAGQVLFNGAVISSFPSSTQHYGLAVDYRGATPVIYPMVEGTNGYIQLLNPVTLSQVTTALNFVAFGANSGTAYEMTINAGDDPVNKPFYFDAGHWLYASGVESARLMGSGWGLAHSYSGRPVVEQFSEVTLVIDDSTGDGITVSADKLSAAYEFDLKMGIRANQSMIGEFRYFESNRLLEEFVKLGNGAGLGVGQGLITGAGKINPYPFDPEQPSMSVNSVRGIWRNLNFIRTYDINTYHYGFIVDYRNINPIVHIIINNQLVYTMVLPDIYQPLFPLLYANTQGSGVFANEINFGAKPFSYNPKQAMLNAGVNTNGFVSGWGHVNNDVDADNLRDSDEAAYGTNILFEDSDGDGIRDGDEIYLYNSSPTNDDSDSDGMPDGYELAVGQNLLLDDSNGDIDIDGQSNINEYNARTGLVDTAPSISLNQGNLQLPTGTNLTLQAVAADILDGNLSDNIVWTDSLVGDLDVTGATYQLTPGPGIRIITASVTDSGGNTAVASITLSVADPSDIDTDNDGLFDEQETLLGTDPNNPDSDYDGIPDGVEVANNFDPLDPTDAVADSDSDGRTNLEEFLDNGDPLIADTGDANGDGLVDIRDALLLQQVILDKLTIDSQALSRCDIYRDGSLTLSDLLLLQRNILKQ